MDISLINKCFRECMNDHKKLETIASILQAAKADPIRDEYAEYYLDKIEEVVRWKPT